MPHKQKLSAEEKVKLIRQIKRGEISIYRAAEEAGAGETSVRRWIAAYEAEGADAFVAHEKNRVYSPELKTEAVLCYLSGDGSLSEIAKRFKIRNDDGGVPAPVLSSWVTPNFDTQVSSRREKCPYALGVDCMVMVVRFKERFV